MRTTTGTGFFIHQNGIVLTNAHVAQFLLLEAANEKITDARCILRGGNPAEPLYHAELLYISPAWINEHANLIAETRPRGTGERDYALLYVSESVNDTPLPETFPTLPFDTALLSKRTEGIEMLSAGYPAESLYTEGADALLTPLVASTTVGELYTFGSNYADIFAIAGSSIGEQGSSGGPVVNEEGNVIGLIVTKGNPEAEGQRSLRALSLSYINRTITEETGFTLRENLEGDLSFRGSVFYDALVPFLASLLTSEIN